MNSDQAPSKPDDYWDRAGEQGYGKAMFGSSDVEAHIRGRLWRVALEIADTLGVPAGGRVLDLGCGDGAFANQMLVTHYRVVDGFDKSEAAIRRAQAESRNHATYRAADLVTFDYDSLPRYDAAFLIGILHHVKHATPDIVRAMTRRTDKMIVLEPNGNSLLRKALEYAPSYRAAGEDSFRSKDLMAIFAAAGWRTDIWRRLNMFPNFTPGVIYRWLRPLETRIEDNRFWNALCTVDMYGLTLAR
ncbi:MAG TPA: class I SAM-dependent methyltransferase [Xanthobacteraceae bacterium]|jgi:SAM-dependent methyltransferase|nr:class I SAM-dependent methyltransferase [Xanthobacteraceae bacterium]